MWLNCNNLFNLNVSVSHFSTIGRRVTGFTNNFNVQNCVKIQLNCLTAVRNMFHNVFVYGTLKCNEPNHHWLTNQENGIGKFIAKGTTKTKYPLIIATKYNIPFLLHSPGDGYNVKGEVYEVDDLMLSKLDILEDHPSYYIREIDDIHVKKIGTEEIIEMKCWVYFLKSFKPELLTKPLLDDYSSKGSHGLPYMESNNESTIDDLDDVLPSKKT